MNYTSDNGYTGTMHKGNFLGMKHWDFTIFDKDGKMVFHSTLKSPYSEEEFKKRVDDFPDLLEKISKLSEEVDGE